MTTRSSDAPNTYELGDIGELPVVASDIIYEGSAVGDNAAGFARPLVAADPFRGFAEQNVDNSAGIAGAKTVRVKERGKIVAAVVGVVDEDDVGELVYMSDDDVFTLTSTSNSLVGKITRHVSGTTAVVAFKSNALPD